MIVDRLIIPFRRFGANGVEEPVELGQLDVRRQRTEWAPLRDANVSTGFDDLLHETHDLWVLNPFRDLLQQHRMPDRVMGRDLSPRLCHIATGDQSRSFPCTR